jgi:hypothetical protein
MVVLCRGVATRTRARGCCLCFGYPRRESKGRAEEKGGGVAEAGRGGEERRKEEEVKEAEGGTSPA